MRDVCKSLKFGGQNLESLLTNPLILSIHQSKGVVMNNFLELVAEEIEFSANKILKDVQNKKRRPAHPTLCPLEMCWSFPC